MEALMSYQGYQLTKDRELLRSLLDKVYEERGYRVASSTPNSDSKKEPHPAVLSNDKK